MEKVRFCIIICWHNLIPMHNYQRVHIHDLHRVNPNLFVFKIKNNSSSSSSHNSNSYSNNCSNSNNNNNIIRI